MIDKCLTLSPGGIAEQVVFHMGKGDATCCTANATQDVVTHDISPMAVVWMGKCRDLSPMLLVSHAVTWPETHDLKVPECLCKPWGVLWGRMCEILIRSAYEYGEIDNYGEGSGEHSAERINRAPAHGRE